MALGGDQTRKVVVVFEARDAGAIRETERLKSEADQLRLTLRDVSVAGRQIGPAIMGAGKQGARGMKAFAADVREARGQMVRLTQAGKGFAAGIKSVGLLGFGFSAITGAISSAASALDEYSAESIEAQQVSQNLQIDISGAREAFGGYVGDVELAKAANKAFALGVVTTGAEFQQLASGVSAQASKTGESAERLLEQATEALGKQSAERLDNILLLLSQAEAEQVYAEEMGKSADQLTDLEKATAFQKAALIKLNEAAATATPVTEDWASSVQQAKVRLENSKSSILGFNDRIGATRDALRVLGTESRETIESLRFGEVAAQGSEAQKRLDKSLSEVGLSLTDLREVAELTNVSFQELLDQTLAGLDEQEERQLKLLDERRVKQLEAEADEVEHTARLLEAMGIDQDLVVDSQLESLELRRQAAELAGDEAAQLKLTRELELLRAKQEAPAKKGGGRGPSRADRVAAAGEARVAALEQEAALLEATTTTSGERVMLEEKQLAAAMARLDLERQVLDATRARGEVARQEQAAKRQALDAEEELLIAEQRNRARDHENELIGEAVALETRRFALQQQAGGRVIELANFRRQDEAARLRSGEQFEAAARVELEIIRQRKRATEELFAVREAELLALRPEDEAARLEQQGALEQLAHEKTMARLEAEATARQVLDAEKQRLAEADAARLEQQAARLDQSISTFEQVSASATQFAQRVISMRNEAADAAHSKEIDRLKQRQAATSASMSRELEAAKGNSKATAGIARKKAKMENSLAAEIERAEAEHQDKRKRQEMRFQGALLLIQAAVQTAKAAAAYPVIPSMIAHGAAAGLNAAFGAMLLGGNIPGAGAGPGLGAGAGAGGARADRDTSESPTTPESVPAADRSGQDRIRDPRALPAGGGSVVNIGQFSVLGSVDDESAEKIGIAIDDARNGREALG